MPENKSIPGSAEEWLARAQGDLALARAPLPVGAFYEDLCFHAQQAAEKALKAVYLVHGWTFRYVHDLEELVTGLRERDLPVPDDVARAVVLTGYAFEVRYPGFGERVTVDEYQQAVALAQGVVQWADTLVERG